MKKTPILLSTLALVAGASGALSTALTLVQPVSASEINLTDANDSPDIYVEELYEMNKYFRIAELDFNKNRIVYDVRGNYTLEGVRAQRALIVMRNYESGVSEEDANEKLQTLGVGDDSWYRTLIDSKTVAATNYMPVKDFELKDNLSDILYFAIQFGEVVTDTNGKKTLENVYWVRGKIDYRKCIHSALFDPSTMVCTTRINNTTQTATIAAISDGEYLMFPDDEQVLTWEEEWRQVLVERIAELNVQLTHIKTQLPTVGTTLYQAVMAIQNLEKTVAGFENTQELDKGLVQLQNLLQQAQNIYDWMIGGEQQKNMDNLQKDLNDALAEIENLKQQSSGGDDELLKAQQELEKLQKELQLLQAKISDLTKELSDKTVTSAEIYDELERVQERMVEVVAEKEKILQKVQILAEDKDVLAVENEKLKQENNELLAENADLVVQNEALTAKIRELEAELAEKMTCTVVGKVRIGDKPLLTTGEDVSNEGIISTSVEIMPEEADVTLPNLGEVETKFNFWWVIATCVGILGALGLYCKKRWNRGC